MKFLKKNIKKIMLVILLMVITGGVSVYATASYLSSQVDYTRNGNTITVEKALNDLFAVVDESTLGKGVTWNSGTFTADAAGEEVAINCGFTPKRIIINSYKASTNDKYVRYYCSEWKSDIQIGTNKDDELFMLAVPVANGEAGITTVSGNGFNFYCKSTSYTYTWYAIK